MSIPPIDVTACSIACANTFRPYWAKLDKRGRWAIVQDVYALARDLRRGQAPGRDPSPDLDYRAAAIELRDRLGGIQNLASYTRTLLVGAAQRPGGDL